MTAGCRWRQKQLREFFDLVALGYFWDSNHCTSGWEQFELSCGEHAEHLGNPHTGRTRSVQDIFRHWRSDKPVRLHVIGLTSRHGHAGLFLDVFLVHDIPLELESATRDEDWVGGGGTDRQKLHESQRSTSSR